MNILNTEKVSNFISKIIHNQYVISASILGIMAIAAAIWNFTKTEKHDEFIWQICKDKIVGNQEFKDTLEAFCTISCGKILNTNLKFQNRPGHLHAILNCFYKLFGYPDQFADIRAVNVLKKIKTVIEANQDFIYINRLELNLDPFFNSLKGSRIAEKHPVIIQQILGLSNPNDLIHLKSLLSIDNDRRLSEVVFRSDLLDAATNGDEDAILLLERVSVYQNSVIKKQIENYQIHKDLNPRHVNETFEFQKDPLKNAHIQLSICYWKRKEFDKAKKAIQLSFENTNVITNNWIHNNALDKEYFDFFQSACLDLSLEFDSLSKNSNESTIEQNVVSLTFKCLVAAKEWIVKNKEEYLTDLGRVLAYQKRNFEALDCFKMALEKEMHLSENYYHIIEVYKSMDDPEHVIEWVKKFFKGEIPENSSTISCRYAKNILEIYNHTLKCQEKNKSLNSIFFR